MTRRTITALTRRDIIRLSDNALTDFGRVVHAVAVTSEAEVLTWAAQKDEDAKPRQGHHNRTDDNGIVHRVDGRRRALCDIDLKPLTVGTGNVMCFACIDAMYPDERDRARYLGQRPDIARAAGLQGLDAAFEQAATLAESMSMDYLVLNIENRRRWAVRDAYAAEELRAYMDALHALALVENTERTVAEVAKQLGTRYYVRRVNDSEFFIVVDADHQNRTVSGMTRDLDEAKTWQRAAHRQWAQRVVNERASRSTPRDTAEQRAPMGQQPAQQHQAADQRPNAIETACKAIVAYKKLSPTMQDAVRGAARRTPTGALLVGWSGFVARRTRSALARRDIMRLSDNELTDFGRVVHAVAVTSEVDVLAWAGRRHAAALIAASRGIVIGGGAALATDDDPATVAFRAALLDELHTRALTENAKRTDTKDSEPVQACATDGHEDRPAIAVHVYRNSEQGDYFGAYQCRECVTCSGDCDAQGDVIEAVSWTPWCRRHTDAWGPAGVMGPDIVLLDSDRHHALIAEQTEGEANVGRLAALDWLPRRSASSRAVLMDVRFHDEHNET